MKRCLIRFAFSDIFICSILFRKWEAEKAKTEKEIKEYSKL